MSVTFGHERDNGAGCRLQVRVVGHCFTKAETTQNFTNANIRPKKNNVSLRLVFL